MSVADHGSEGACLGAVGTDSAVEWLLANHVLGGASDTPWGRVQQARLAGEKAGLRGDLDTAEVSAHPRELCLP